MSRILDHAQLLNPRRTGVALATCLTVAAVVAGCGGGDRVKSFQPTQIIAFGDENSAFDDTSTLPAPFVDFRTIPNAPVSTATVPYKARYTINLVGDAGFLCKLRVPVVTAKAGCVADSSDTANPSGLVLPADFPSSTSFFVAQSSASNYRLAGDIPVVGELETGFLTEAVSGTPNPVYRSTDHAYYCSTDFGDDFGNWVQRLARGLGGGGLNMGGATGCQQDSGGSRSYAAWGAKVANVQAQVAAHRGELRDGVLVALLAGQNDIMAAYNEIRAGTLSENNAHLRLREQGGNLGLVIKDIATTGARVVYLTVPDMGKSPEASANPALASLLTRSFNEGYKAPGEDKEVGGLTYTTGTNGHKIVKVEAYPLVTSLGNTYGAVSACETNPLLAKMPNGQTLASALPSIDFTPPIAAGSDAAKALLLNCRSNNLRVLTPAVAASGATVATPEVRAYYGNFLWADARRLGPMGHGNLANLAVARIRDQL